MNTGEPGGARRELELMQRELQRTKQAIARLGSSMRDAGKQMQQFGQSATEALKSFSQEASRMQQEMQKLKDSMSELGNANAQPTVTLKDKLSAQWDNIRTKLWAQKDVLLNLVIGTDFKGVLTDVEEAAKQRRLYAASGKTDAQIKDFERRADEIVHLNPEMTKGNAMALVAKSEEQNGKYGGKYAENAARMAYTTGRDSSELLTAMSAMRDATHTYDADRIGNSLQHIMNNGRNLDSGALLSLIKSSKEMNQVLDTPEKIAAMVDSMNKLGVLSMDKGFEAIKEAATQLTSSGDLAKVLQTGYEAIGKRTPEAKDQAEREAKEVEQLLTSGSKEDVQHAFGKLLQTFAAVKDDKARDKMLDALGKSAGQEMKEKLGPLLAEAGRLATGDVLPQVGNDMEQSYQRATANDMFFTRNQAKSDARVAVDDTGAKVIGDALPILTTISQWTQKTAEALGNFPDLLRQGIEVGLGAIVLGVAAKKFFTGSTAGGAGNPALTGNCCCCDSGGETETNKKQKRAKNKKSKSNPKPKNSNTGGKNQPGEAGSGAGQPKRTWWNPLTWWKKTTTTREEPNAQKGLLGGLKEKLTTFIPSKETLARGWTMAKNAGPQLVGWLKRAVPNMKKAIPYAGIGIGIADVLTNSNKNKTDAWLRFGAETLGGLAGGAAAGAVAGSFIPVPVAGTVVGSAIGGIAGIIGATLGSLGGGALYDSVKGWFPKPAQPNERDELEREKQAIRAAANKPQPDPQTMLSPRDRVLQMGVPVPPQSPATKSTEQSPKTVSLTIPNMPITINAAGILQDEAGLLKMLNKGTISTQIMKLVEKGMVDAMETRGGVAGGRVGGVPV